MREDMSDKAVIFWLIKSIKKSRGSSWKGTNYKNSNQIVIYLVCVVYIEHLYHSISFTSLFEGRGLMGQVSQQCIVIGEDLQCLYRGFEVILGALDVLVKGR